MKRHVNKPGVSGCDESIFTLRGPGMGALLMWLMTIIFIEKKILFRGRIDAWSWASNGDYSKQIEAWMWLMMKDIELKMIIGAKSSR